jgi:hypothetical protein
MDVSEIAHQTKTFDSKLQTALYSTASAVFSTSFVQKPSIPVKVLCGNVKYHQSQSIIGSNEEFSRAGLARTLEF